MTEAFARADDPLDYIVDPLAVPGFVTVLAGKHSSYKSWLLTATGAAAHAGGAEAVGMECRRARVLYVDAENRPRTSSRGASGRAAWPPTR